jgi:hypothetical protein
VRTSYLPLCLSEIYSVKCVVAYTLPWPCSREWGETLFLHCSHQWPIVHPPDDILVWSHSGMIFTGKNRRNQRKPCPMPFCPPQIPHGLTRAWTWASTVRGQQLTTWPMVWPSHDHCVPRGRHSWKLSYAVLLHLINEENFNYCQKKFQVISVLCFS